MGILVKFCMGYVVLFTEFRQWDRYPRSTKRKLIFCFHNALWASVSSPIHCLYADDGKLYEVIETRITNSVGNATRVPEKPGNRPFSNP